MREIVLDTETTGLDPLRGDRLVEIGAVELMNHRPTGKTFHVYINPERDMPEEAFRVHGLSAEFLSDKPLFSGIAAQFIDFIGDSKLVIHNASFDIGFINAELDRVKWPAVPRDRLVDTLMIARRRFPAGPNNLDALCARFGIDNTKRVKHGALLDAELLAEVYIDLIGVRQATLALAAELPNSGGPGGAGRKMRERKTPLAPRVSAEDDERHRAFIAEMGDKAYWLKTALFADKTTG